MVNPGKDHWRIVQWIFKYLCGTCNAYLQFGNLEIDLLVLLILIMLVIWIRGGLSRVMFSLLVTVLLARKKVCRLMLLCLL